MKNGRWWNSLGNPTWKKFRPGMVPFNNQRIVTGIPKPIAELVFEEHIREYPNHTLEEILELGGFSTCETIAALADIIERERAVKKKADFDAYQGNPDTTQREFPENIKHLRGKPGLAEKLAESLWGKEGTSNE